MKKYTLLIIGAICILLSLALIMFAAKQGTMSLYIMPDQLLIKEISPKQKIKLGGMLVEGSISDPDENGTFSFKLSHNDKEVTARFTGLPPALFVEGKETIVEGWYKDGIVEVETILAKHDADYEMPERHKNATN